MSSARSIYWLSWTSFAAITVASFTSNGVIVLVRIAANTLPPSMAATVTFIWLGYVIYSWVWPPILKKLI